MMRFRRVRRVAEDCSGATAVEYAVLLCLLVLVSTSVIHAIGSQWTSAILASLAEKLPA